MLNSKVSKRQKAFINFIEKEEVTKSQIERTQPIRVEYSFFTDEENKKELKNIFDHFKEYNKTSELNYYFEESVAYCKGKLIAYQTKVQIQFVFHRFTKSNKELFSNMAKDVVYVENLVSNYRNKKYPQEFSIRCCFFIFDLERRYNVVREYLAKDDYFNLYSCQNKFLKGVINYNYTISLIRNAIVFQGYTGNISHIGIIQAFYDIVNYLTKINDELVIKIKG